MRRNRRAGFLAVPYELDDLPLWDGDAALKAVFLQLCFWANHASGVMTWRRSRLELARGEVATSAYELAEKTGLSRDVIRRCIDRLQKEGLISFRQKNTEPLADAKNPLAKPLAGVVYIVNNYDKLFGAKQRKAPSKAPSDPLKCPQQPDSVPLYAGNTRTHTHGSGGGVCDSSSDEGKPASQPADPSQSDPNSSFLEHPLVIAWNAAANHSKLEMVSEATPSRLRALEAAFRARNDMAFWRVVIAEAKSPKKIDGKYWLPRFNWILNLDNAVQLYESGIKKQRLRSVPPPPPQGDTVGTHAGNGPAGPMPARPVEPRALLKPGDLMRQFRESLT